MSAQNCEKLTLSRPHPVSTLAYSIHNRPTRLQDLNLTVIITFPNIQRLNVKGLFSSKEYRSGIPYH